MSKNLADIYVGVKKDDPNRNKNDLYPTPPLATYILHKYIDLPKNIVEPCAGKGNISIELQRCGYNVKSYDLYEYEDSLVKIETGHDVLDLKKPDDYAALVTNPPYHKDLPRKIAEKGVAEYDLTALFVRLTFLEGKKRKNLFTNNNVSDIIFLSDRINFGSNKLEPVEINEQIGGMIAYCWIVFRKNKIHENTKLHWVVLSEEYEEWKKHYEEKNESISSILYD